MNEPEKIDPRELSPWRWPLWATACWNCWCDSVWWSTTACLPESSTQKKVKYVSARAQFREEQLLEPLFTEDELAVFKRGRNASKGQRGKARFPGGIPCFHRLRVPAGLAVSERSAGLCTSCLKHCGSSSTPTKGENYF